jgi:hypothetical protein
MALLTDDDITVAPITNRRRDDHASLRMLLNEGRQIVTF